MDKYLLKKGFKLVSISIFSCFIGPVIVYQSFKNKDHPLYYFVLSIGLLFLLIALYTGFKGIMAIAKSFLGEKKKEYLTHDCNTHKDPLSLLSFLKYND